jgi:hypothetical protein
MVFAMAARFRALFCTVCERRPGEGVCVSRNERLCNKVYFLESRGAVYIEISAMIELAIQVFEISVQVVFPAPNIHEGTDR